MWLKRKKKIRILSLTKILIVFCQQRIVIYQLAIFFIEYLASPRSTLSYYWWDSFIYPMLNTAFFDFWPEDHQQPRNKVESLSPAENLLGFESGTFRSNRNALQFLQIKILVEYLRFNVQSLMLLSPRCVGFQTVIWLNVYRERITKQTVLLLLSWDQPQKIVCFRYASGWNL